MKIIRTILKSHYFSEQPPILIDIGASGEINKKWKFIAPYSTCVAFDADDRDFQINEITNSQFRRLITFNRIVTDEQSSYLDFYLTKSPYCSSLLKPDMEKLKPWVFHSLFEVEKTISLSAITLTQSLSQAGIDYVDWFKTDTQGTDLRLFRSLSTDVSKNILVAEFEPGIIDAYQGEDKLYMIMQEMHEREFWLSSMDVKGTQRLSADYAGKVGKFKSKRIFRRSPCWAEVTYLRQPFHSSERQLLLLIVFALLEEQYGFALEVIDFGESKYRDEIFSQCKKAVFKKIATEKWKIPFVIMKRQLNKLFSSFND